MQPVKQILSTHQLRITQSRLDVLSLLINKGTALSQPEIEDEMHGQCDRVTIYRTLATFLDKGLVHKVLDDAGAAKYALCAGGCHETTAHNHNHVHFKCSMCGQTLCINDVHVPTLSLPGGFRVHEQNVLIQGTCPGCS